MNIQTARRISARIWCDPEYPYVMNPDLAEEIAQKLMIEANHQSAQQGVVPELTTPDLQEQVDALGEELAKNHALLTRQSGKL